MFKRTNNSNFTKISTETKKLIFLDIGHQEVKELIEEHFPNKYKIEFFVELDELQPNSIVVLHP